MPKFSQESFTRLSTCHIDLQVLFFEVIKKFDCTIEVGHRGEEDQHKAFLAGKSKLDWPHGKHNMQPSNAVDVVPDPVDFNNIKQFIYFAGYVMGTAFRLREEGKITHLVRWGGDWNQDNMKETQDFNDFAHFELDI